MFTQNLTFQEKRIQMTSQKATLSNLKFTHSLGRRSFSLTMTRAACTMQIGVATYPASDKTNKKQHIPQKVEKGDKKNTLIVTWSTAAFCGRGQHDSILAQLPSVQRPVSWRPTTIKWWVFTVWPSFHHWHSTNPVSWSITIVGEQWGEVWLHVHRWW